MTFQRRLLPLLILTAAHIVCALNRNWVDSLTGRSCNHFAYISIQHLSEPGVRDKYNDDTDKTANCPPWYWPAGNGTCQFGNDPGGVVMSNPHSMQTMLENYYCMTTSSTGNETIIGKCLFSTPAYYYATPYFPLPCNISELNEFMCAGLNREGQLCGKCREGFAPPAYSYSLSCVNCTEYSLNWLRYLAVAFGPLTLFVTFVTVFHIHPTSSYFDGFILASQLFCLPAVIRSEIYTQVYHDSFVHKLSDVILFTILGVWNLDFFRLVYEPFCIHPRMTVPQTLALEYVIALYPLALLSLTYFLVSLYYHNFRVVVIIWKPFKHILKPCLPHINLQSFLISSLATFFLLSTAKLQSVSVDLLVPSTVYYMDGTCDSKNYMRLAGDVEYFGPEHLAYAILAIAVFVIFVGIPIILLFLYPCHCFQKCLNKCHYNFHCLQTFLDIFLGPYRDRTISIRDYRYFAGTFFLFRTLIILCVSTYLVLAFSAILLIIFSALVAFFQPHKSKKHSMISALFLLYLSLAFLSLAPCLQVNSVYLLTLINIIVYFAPLLYIIGLITCWMVGKMGVPEIIFRKLHLHFHAPPDEEYERLTG